VNRKQAYADMQNQIRLAQLKLKRLERSNTSLDSNIPRLRA
jgi:hypothetical protein